MNIGREKKRFRTEAIPDPFETETPAEGEVEVPVAEREPAKEELEATRE